MKDNTIDNIIQKIKQVSDLYYRLIIVVSPSGSGKTDILKNIHDRLEIPIINVNLRLSKQMLELSERQRILQLIKMLDEIIDENKEEVALLDNIEMLFDVALKQDPLRLLQNLSRKKTIITTWNGEVENDHLIYAEPDHPEYRRYSTNNLTIICPEVKT